MAVRNKNMGGTFDMVAYRPLEPVDWNDTFDRLYAYRYGA